MTLPTDHWSDAPPPPAGDDNTAPTAGPAYRFGPFRLVPAQHQLLRNDVPVPLGSRALDILTLLVERAGSLVTKRELMARGWAGTVVEDSNIKAAIASLRRVFDDGQGQLRYLVNIPRRGYQFVAPVTRIAAVDSMRDDAARPGHLLPTRATRMLGREAALDSLVQAIATRRLVTIAGPGGVGKTTIALSVARSLLDAYDGEVCFVDLSTLPEPSFIAPAIAKALNLTMHAKDVGEALVLALRERRVLLILDSCDHVLQAAAELADSMLSLTQAVTILATSREPLRVAGEKLHRLGPLATPPPGSVVDAAEAMTFSAIALFVDRAGACVEDFALTDADAPIVVEICQKLEGLPLAIELTATRVDTFALRDLCLLLDDRVRVLKLERRGAQARHTSLQATIDWSFSSLSERERVVLRRIAVFRGAFDLTSAAAVVATSSEDLDIIAAMDGLVSKSLVIAQPDRPMTRYRLFDSTRSYAASRLAESGDLPSVRRRHALHLRAVLTHADQVAQHQPSAQWLAEHRGCIDDVRSAIGWAASVEGDPELAVALTISAIPLWTQMSLLEECRINIERAINPDTADAPISAHDAMRLHAGLGTALLHAHGPRPEIEEVWSRTLAIADQLGDVRHQFLLWWGLAVFHVYTGEYRVALRRMRRFRTLARSCGDQADQVSAERLTATLLHYLGRHTSASRRLAPVLRALPAPSQQAHVTRFQIDQHASSRGTLATLLWLQGQTEQAIATAHDMVREARASGHPLSLCNAIGHIAIPIALHSGDIALAERLLAELLQLLSRHALPVQRLQADCIEGTVMIARGELAGAKALGDALHRLDATAYRLRRSYLLSVLAQGHALTGSMPAAQAAIDEALSWADATAERWYLPETMRIKAELLRRYGEPHDRPEIKRLLRKALELTRAQGAPMWELRTATSLAQVLLEEGQPAKAHDELAPLLVRLSTSSTSIDVAAARSLTARIEACQPAHSWQAPASRNHVVHPNASNSVKAATG